MEVEALKNKICKILDDKKAEDIKILKVDHMTVVADYFIVATGRNNTHVRTLAEEIEDKLEKDDELRALRDDGIREGKWAVLDYGSIMVHIFNDDTRVFYCLEKLWSDGSNIETYQPEA